MMKKRKKKKTAPKNCKNWTPAFIHSQIDAPPPMCMYVKSAGKLKLVGFVAAGGGLQRVGRFVTS
jgi:hypothetical protein